MFSRLWLSRCLVVLLIAGLSTMAGAARASGPAAAGLTCLNLLANSNMESNSGWMFAPSPATGFYTTERAASPVRSAQLGITAGSNVNAYSSLRQTVVVPAGDQLRLRLQVLQLSQPPDANDQQEIRILDATNGATLRQVWSALGNDGVWKGLQFDLNEFIGRTIVLYINARNDGAGGKTAMFVDDVVLELCSSGGPTATPTTGLVTATPTAIVVTNTPTPPIFVTATPTPWVVTNTPTPPIFVTATPTPWVVTNTPTPPLFVTATPTLGVVTNTPTAPPFITATPTPAAVTATPTSVLVTATPTSPPSTVTPTYTPAPPPPSGCKECLINTGFEKWGVWYFARTALQAAYSGAQAHTGLRSAVLGNPNPLAPNYVSYSSVRQKAVLPRGEIRTAFLDFWHYTVSDLESDDRQEAIILDANTGRTLEVLWRVNRNDRSWQHEQFDLTRYLGRAIVVYFNVYNGGGSGRASMYVDDVQLSICGSLAPTPGAIVATAVTPTPPEVVISSATADLLVLDAVGGPTPSFPPITVVPPQPGALPPVDARGFVTQAGLLARLFNFIRSPINCFITILLLVVFGLIIVLLWRIIKRVARRP